MSIRKLDKKEWRAFFDSLSRTLQGARVEIDVVSLSIGNQVQADWRPMIGVAYDPREDVLELALDGLDHMIANPEDIFFDEEEGRLKSLEIVDREKISQIVTFKDPVPAPAPTGR